MKSELKGLKGVLLGSIIMSFAGPMSVILGNKMYTEYCANQNVERFKDIPEQMDNFLKSTSGAPLLLDDSIAKQEIQICIRDGFTKDEKAEIYRAINEFDAAATGLEYNIFESNTPDSSKSIIFSKNYLGSDGIYHTLGEASFTRDNTTSKIIYPISVDLTTDKLHLSMYNHVVKHELMHTLGFADLYKEEDSDKMMFHTFHPSDITEEELETINTLY